MTLEYTDNYGFEIPEFNTPTWGPSVDRNFHAIDALIHEAIQVTALTGVWDNSVAWEVGDRAVDDESGAIYTCLVENTSPATGTFDEYRTANPTHWLASTLALTPRGEWANGTVYNRNDLVYDIGEGVSAICTTTHTSSGAPDTIRDDEANWAFIIDISAGTVAGDDVTYDNGVSGLTASDVQAAIDELVVTLDAVNAAIALKANSASPTFSGSPTAPTQATSDESTKLANTLYVANKIAAQGVLQNYTVRLATTGNIDLSTDIDNNSTLDDETISTGDKILVKDQTDASENGIYIAPASGAASRSTDFDTWNEHIGKVINVTEGTVNAEKSYRNTNNAGGTLDTTDITFILFGSNIALPIGPGDGGTGETSLVNAFAAMKQAASETATGVVERATSAEVITGTDTDRYVSPATLTAKLNDVGVVVASQAEMEAASAVNRIVTPGRLHFHPGVAKCWAMATVSGGVPTLQNSYNVASITDTELGRLTVTIATDFSSANWCCVVSTQKADTNADGGSVRNPNIRSGGQLAGSILIECGDSDYDPKDPAAWHMAGYGDMA